MRWLLASFILALAVVIILVMAVKEVFEMALDCDEEIK